MQRATAEQRWHGVDAADDSRLHPLRSRLNRPAIAAQPGTDLRTAANAPPAVAVPTTAPQPAQQVVRTPSPPQSAKRRAGSAASYGVLGFILGAIFWHFVGFWDFVGQIMFRGRPSDTQISQAPPPVKLRERVSGAMPLAVVIEPAACTTLLLDRETGITQATACEVEALPLRSLKTARREDVWVTAGQRIQEATSKGWSTVTVETPEPAHSQASAD